MLITHLGQARRELLASFQGLDEAALNRRDEAGRSIAHLVYRTAMLERALADCIIAAYRGDSARVAAKSRQELEAACAALRAAAPAAPADYRPTRAALVRLLEETRFRDLQRVLNKTHARALAEKSVQHPQLGAIGLENLLDLVWLNDRASAASIQARSAARQSPPSQQPSR